MLTRYSKIFVVVLDLVLALAVGVNSYYVTSKGSLGHTSTLVITQTASNVAAEIAPTTATQVVFQTTTATATVIRPRLEAETTNNATGLRLEVTTNTSVISEGVAGVNVSRSILAVISLFNVLSRENNVSASNQWPIENLSSGSCSFNSPFGIAVFRGYYTSANISQSGDIRLFPAQWCAVISLPPNYYLFDPESYFASSSAFTSYANSTGFSSVVTHTVTKNSVIYRQSMIASFQIAGICCNEYSIPTCLCFTYIPDQYLPGVYTLAGGDEWGDLVILHFTVSK